jgi:hypothetical protein
LFRRNATTYCKNRKFWAWTIVLLALATLGMGQEPGKEAESEDQQPIPVPIRADDETRSLGAQTFVDDVFQNTQNRWGFSLIAYQAYSTDVSEDAQSNASSGITVFMPRTFFNFGKRKSKFHVDLGTGYRYYSRQKNLNSWDYYGDAQHFYRFSRRTSIQLSNQFTSSYNDAYSFVSLYDPIGYNPGYTNVRGISEIKGAA